MEACLPNDRGNGPRGIPATPMRGKCRPPASGPVLGGRPLRVVPEYPNLIRVLNVERDGTVTDLCIYLHPGAAPFLLAWAHVACPSLQRALQSERWAWPWWHVTWWACNLVAARNSSQNYVVHGEG
jgi:hypothetical protein